jgi:hypothetical protein
MCARKSPLRAAHCCATAVAAATNALRSVAVVGWND